MLLKRVMNLITGYALAYALLLLAVLATVKVRPWVVQPAEAQSVSFSTLPDITGDGSAHQVAATGSGRWVQIIAPAANSAAVRIGRSDVSSSKGAPVAPGAGFLLPPSTNINIQYSLNSIYYYAGNGDKLSVIWGN